MSSDQAATDTAENVPLQHFKAITGITPKAVYNRIARGDWLQGYEFDRSRTGTITVYMPGYRRWARGLDRVERTEP